MCRVGADNGPNLFRIGCSLPGADTHIIQAFPAGCSQCVRSARLSRSIDAQGCCTIRPRRQWGVRLGLVGDQDSGVVGLFEDR
eukprot:958922-Lingulodinium_polyedra.AAC.1